MEVQSVLVHGGEEGLELAGLFIPGFDAAGEDVVVPAVDGESSVGEGAGDGGLGLEVGELGDDIAADERGEFGVFAFVGTEGLAVGEGAFDVAEPAAGLGEVFEAFAVESGLEGSAVGVTAEDGVLYFEDFDGVLDGGGDAIDFGAGDGDDVAGVAGDEEVAGLGLEDEVGNDAGVRAGDEQPLGVLDFSEEVEMALLAGEDFVVEALMSFDETVHGVDEWLLCGGQNQPIAVALKGG